MGSWGGRIFGRQKDLWGFREGSFSHQTCWKPPLLGKLSFVVFISYPGEYQTSETPIELWGIHCLIFFLYIMWYPKGEKINDLSIMVTCWRMILCHANGRTQRFPSVISMTLAFSMWCSSNVAVIQRECNPEISSLALWGARIHEYVLKTCINPFWKAFYLTQKEKYFCLQDINQF